MFSNFKNLVKLTGQLIKECEFKNGFLKENLFGGARCDVCNRARVQYFRTGTPRNRVSPELQYRKAAKYDAKREGRVENIFKGDLAVKRSQGYFPKVDLPNTLFDGKPFKDLPIVSIKATRNNTILSLADQGNVKVSRSCGTEGFKNARKGTNVAAQAAGIALGLRAIKRGYQTVRVVITGLGPGRLSSIKGLQLSGMNVISVTDSTVYRTTLRPRKQRRL